jgi:hypothetical protein
MEKTNIPVGLLKSIQSGKDTRFRAPSPHQQLTHPATITFATPAALAKSSSVT